MARRKSNPTMTQEDFEKWQPLIHSVLKTRFWWAYNPPRRGKHPARPKFLWNGYDYDDLVQEGGVALQDAWRRFDARRGVDFITYAHASIFNRLVRYIGNNLYLIKVPEGESPVLTERPAEGSLLFLATGPRKEYNEPTRELRDDERDPAEVVGDREFVDYCMKRLRERLGKRKTTLLLRWKSGALLRQIGKTLGVSREWARILLDQWMIEAYAILADLSEESKLWRRGR